MRTINFIIWKEFKQIFRDKGMLPIIFVIPIIQLLILANAATFDIKNIKVMIIDRDNTSVSRLLIAKYNASNYFKLVGTSFSSQVADDYLADGKIDMFIEIPANFERDLIRQNVNKMMIVVNAVDGTKGNVGMNYSTSLINDFNQEIRQKYSTINITLISNSEEINIIQSNWYNPELNYKLFMVPGILVLLVAMIATFLTAMNIVKEKEIGTIEQINVTPILKYQFLAGKLIPFWLIGMFELAFGMIIASIFYEITFVGNIGLIFLFAAVFLIAVEGLGLFISTISDTQQQAMFIAWFLLVIFILLSGLFTAVENMPGWTQNLTYLNPIRYFIELVRMIMLKGSGFEDTKIHFAVMTFFAIFINTIAIWRYKKTV